MTRSLFTLALTLACLASSEPMRAADAENQAAESRPRLLMPLLITYGTLQAADLVTTFNALEHGAVERNPMMAGLTGNLPAAVVVKAAGTAATIWAAERLWRDHRVGAILLMVAVNAGMGAVVWHNASVVRRQSGTVR